MKNQEIIEVFNKEFESVKHKFKIFEFSLNDPRILEKSDELAKPGVYVIWKNNEVIKVGESIVNSRKRLLEGWATELNDNSNNIILFNIINEIDKHWVAALEIFFEINLHPIIPADRIG